MIVVDASVVVDALIGAAVAAERLSAEALAAPALLDAEVGGAVRRRWLRRELDPEQADAAVADLITLEISRFDHVVLLARAWSLRNTMTFTDALYVALAERLDVPLVTLDAKLARAPGMPVTVEFPGRTGSRG